MSFHCIGTCTVARNGAKPESQCPWCREEEVGHAGGKHIDCQSAPCRYFLRQRLGDQPLPVPNDEPDIQSQVIVDLAARRQLGIERYGTALQPHNGRDSDLDAYEEAMDLTVYLKQRLIERTQDAHLASVMRKLIAAKIVFDVSGPIEGPYMVEVVKGDTEITEDEGHALIGAAGRG